MIDPVAVFNELNTHQKKDKNPWFQTLICVNEKILWFLTNKLVIIKLGSFTHPNAFLQFVHGCICVFVFVQGCICAQLFAKFV